MNVRRTRHYAKQTAAAFPLLKEKAVVTVCVEFMKLLYEVVRRNQEVVINGPGKGLAALHLKIYKPNYDVERVNLGSSLGAVARRNERMIRQRRRRIRRDLGLGPAPDLFETS